MLLLAMPMHRPKPKFFITVVLALTISVHGAFLFLPFLLHQELVGLLLLSLALFHCFYFTARGGTAVVGTLVTISLAMTVAVGSVSVDALLGVVSGLTVGATVGALVALIAHSLIPDQPLEAIVASAASDDGKTETVVDLPAARRSAMRSLAVVFPVVFWFLLSGASAGNMAVMVKVAAMGQEVSQKGTRAAAGSLIMSTVAGGLAAIVCWQVLSIWPSLAMYTLLMLLAGLYFGKRIFSGNGLHPDAATWNYAFLTLIVVLAPAALDSDFGSDAGARFYDRLFMFFGATAYGVTAVYIFDAFWPGRKK